MRRAREKCFPGEEPLRSAMSKFKFIGATLVGLLVLAGGIYLIYTAT